MIRTSICFIFTTVVVLLSGCTAKNADTDIFPNVSVSSTSAATTASTSTPTQPKPTDSLDLSTIPQTYPRTFLGFINGTVSEGNFADVEASINAGADSLTEILPGFFTINSDGTMTSTVYTKLVDFIHSKNMKCVPRFANGWDQEAGRAALANIDAITSELADAVEKYNLDGINVDLENLTIDDRDKLVEFVAALQKKLPSGAILSVDVAAIPDSSFYIDDVIGGPGREWTKAYDFGALSKHCDYLMLMSYDEHTIGTNPGPVASIDYLEGSIVSVIKSGCSPQKLVLGIPFYARIWSDNDVFNGKAVYISGALGPVKKFGGSVTYDESGACYIGTLISPGSSALFYGKKLLAGTYTVYTDGDLSFDKKLELLGKYKLRGVGAWALGQASDNQMNHIASILNK